MRRRLLAVASAALVVVAMHANPARVFAQSGTWASNGSTQSGTSVWSNTSNWVGGVVANGTNNTATFTATTNTYTGLTGNITLGNLTTSSGRIYVTGTDTNLSFQTPSAFQLQFATTTGTAPRITNAGRLDMSVVVAGTQGFTKAGNGTLYLWAPNVYSGVTTISGTSQIYLRNADGLGAVGAGNGTVVQAGSTLRIDTSMTTAAEPLTISGSGQPSTSFLGALRTNTAGTVGDYTGPITLAADAKISAGPDTTLTLSGAIDLGPNKLQLQDSGNLAISGAIGGTGSVDYTGTGPAGLVLSGYNTFSGSMAVANTGGPFSLTGYLTGSTSVRGNSRSVIGTGTFAGGLYVGNTNFLSPGASGTAASDSYGTLTASSLEVQSATVLMGIQDATTYDRLVMTAGSGGLALGGSANLVFDFANPMPAATLNLLSFTGLSGNFQGVTSTGVYAGTWTYNGGVWSLENVGPEGNRSFALNLATGALAVVPEPSTIALVGGVAAVASLIRLRRRCRHEDLARPALF